MTIEELEKAYEELQLVDEPKECYLNPVEKLNPEHAFDSKDYYCSLCNYNIKFPRYNFCPNCGAKIKRGEK